MIKKYSNRRLYDTTLSRYITLEELAAKVRGGEEVTVVDAKSGDDLTQSTLVQLILESPTARLLPVGLLHRLLRMQDDAIAEFFSSYVTWALDLYLAMRKGSSGLRSSVPFAGNPWAAANPFAQMFSGGLFGPPAPATAPPAASPPPPTPPSDEVSPASPSDTDAEAGRDRSDEISQLRAELDELKRSLQG